MFMCLDFCVVRKLLRNFSSFTIIIIRPARQAKPNFQYNLRRHLKKNDNKFLSVIPRYPFIFHSFRGKKSFLWCRMWKIVMDGCFNNSLSCIH